MSDIHCVKSPFFITYSNLNTYTHIIIDLFIWTGSTFAKPALPTHSFTQLRTSNNVTFIELGDYIYDFIDIKPNSTFFTSINPYYNEIVNFSYTIKPFNANNALSVVISSHAYACAGYGNQTRKSNPTIKITPKSRITIDSTLITIDDTMLITIDNTGYSTLIDQEYRYNKANSRVFNVFVSDFFNNSNNVLNRFLTTDYKGKCWNNDGEEVMFINSNGIIDVFPFPKKIIKKIKATQEITKVRNRQVYNYNVYESNAIIEKESKLHYDMNTDLLDDYNVGILLELIASDKHWLIDYENQRFIEIILTETDFEIKNEIKDRAKIQYTLSFASTKNYIK